MKNALVPLAPGFEEIEAITIIDILRRAGVNVTVAGTQPGPIEASRKTNHLPDCTLDKIHAEDFDLLVLPGGQPGTDNLRRDPRLRQIIQNLNSRQCLLAAICAAPTVLGDAGVLTSRIVTGHPSVHTELATQASQVSNARVVVDGKIITGQSPGAAMEFAFKLVEILCGPTAVAEVNSGVLARLF